MTEQIGDRCKKLFNEKIPGWWHIAGVVLMTIPLSILSIQAAVRLMQQEGWSRPIVITLFLSPLIFLGLSYWLRNVTAKILARYYIGLPALLIALGLNHYNIAVEGVSVGPWAIGAAVLLWVWPVWPVVAVIFVILGAMAPALGKMGGPTMGSRR